MLKLRRRRGTVATIDTGADALRVRDLLDDPRLRAVMGDVGDSLVEPMQLDWGRTVTTPRNAFGRRLLQRAA